MRTATMIGVAVIAVAVASPSEGAFTRLVVEEFVGEGWIENGYAGTGLTTYRVYAEFDGVGEEGVFAVFGSAADPMHVSSSDGQFYNDVLFGGLGPPIDLTHRGIWTNQWDTYVTINATSSPAPLNITPQFSSETNDLQLSWTTPLAAWFVTPEDQEHLPVNGRVLVAQLSVATGAEVSGELALSFPDGTAVRHAFGSRCSGDVDGSQQVDFGDVLALLASWGPCEGCPEDVDEDGDVDFADLVAVLAAWGPCFEAEFADLTCACCDADVCLPDWFGHTIFFQHIIEILDVFGGCGGCPQDVDCNGIVDARDIVIVLWWWGQQPDYCP